MCGIVGYIGSKDAQTLVLEGLAKLEYRGYDSAGIALFDGQSVQIRRAKGKLASLRELLTQEPIQGPCHVGIGHTRWATHGRPSEHNAHPHSAGRVSLIHNGIIENYVELRSELQKLGCVFTSETDTEIAAHLIHLELVKGHDPLQAMKHACERIKGSYALIALDSAHPDRIVVAKTGTPLVIGVGEGEMLVASDIPALLDHTRDVIILEDGDFAEIRSGSLLIEHEGKSVTRPVTKISWDPITAQKGGFKHYMLKEIHEQVQVLSYTMRGRISTAEPVVALPGFDLAPDTIRRLRRVIFVGCGTAWHACLLAKYLFEAIAKIPCEVDYASEFRYRQPILTQDDLVVAISQSGETADTVAAIQLAHSHASTAAICNVLGSSITRRTPHVLFTQAGPEISVASTKAFTTQIVAAYLLAMYLGQHRGTVTPSLAEPLLDALVHLPHAVEETVKLAPVIEKIAKHFQSARDFLFLGRGICYPVALEGALKLKEISYIHAEGYPAGEIKHGPIALVDEHMPVVMLLPRQAELYEKTFSNLREVESRGGRIFAITDTERPGLAAHCEHLLTVPHVSPLLASVIMTVPLQLLAYYVAVLNGTDVDLPRNLAKSVTVE
jgi:glutamine---fructose-6-phosphate transaminase (isomerizing)